MSTMRIAIFGYGTVGRGVADALDQAGQRIETMTGTTIELVSICDLMDLPDDPRASLLTKDGNSILNDETVNLIVECMGVVGYAYEVTKRALSSGKSVVTSNKALVAKHGMELKQLALKNEARYSFEAAVGGGIPLLRTLQRELRTNTVTAMAGILNGTTNYILTEMGERGLSYGAALKAAQDLGYAEADPTDDVEGFDTLRKLAILGSIITGEAVNYETIPCRGIVGLQPEDFSWAQELDYKIALLAHYSCIDGQYAFQVSPFYVPADNPLAMVSGVYNAALFKADLAGTFLLYGEGAGGLATASAILADILQIAIHPFDIDRAERKVWCDNGIDTLIIPEDELRWRYAFRFGRDDLKGKLNAKRILNELMVTHETKGGAPGTLAVSKELLDRGRLNELLEVLEPEQYLPIYEDWK